MHITISQISFADARSFRNCLDTVAREKRYLAQIEAPSYEETEGFVRESVETDAVQFVALEGSTVVGWADIFPSWAHAVRHCGTLGMGVLQSYRGQGLGRRLLVACIQKAKTKGMTRIQLQVRADNDVAITLYESVGFRHEARMRHALCFDGVYYDAVQMSLLTD
jgi:ribosomal protein S18 acetylase RimI-like enzyme